LPAAAGLLPLVQGEARLAARRISDVPKRLQCEIGGPFGGSQVLENETRDPEPPSTTRYQFPNGCYLIERTVLNERGIPRLKMLKN
jgi:hypothetical protein